MTTGKCLDCGADRMHGVLRCKDCHGQWLIDYMSFTQPELKQDHWTFPDDPEVEPRPGWGPFKFDWVLKPFKAFVEWHDRVTVKGSEAQKIGVTNEQINDYTRRQLEEIANKPKNGLQKRLAWFVGFFLSKVNRFFYEGKLK